MDLDKSIINIENEDGIYIIDEENKNSLGEETFCGEESFKASEDNVTWEEDNVTVSEDKKKVSNNADTKKVQSLGQAFGAFVSVVSGVLVLLTSLGLIPSIFSISVDNFISRSTELGFEVNKEEDKTYLMSLYNDDYKEEVELTNTNIYVYTDLNPNTVYNFEVYDITEGQNKKLYSANYLTADKDDYSAYIVESSIINNKLYLDVEYEGVNIEFVTVDIQLNGKSVLLYEGAPKKDFVIDLNEEFYDIKCKIYVNGKVTHFVQRTSESPSDTTPGEPTEETVAVEDLSLNYNEISLTVGETFTLEESIYPLNATDKTVVWSTSKESVATVENGLVTAVGVGSAIIRVETADGRFEAECSVRVTGGTVLAESIELNYTELDLIVGNYGELRATVLPYNTSNPNVTWESSDESVATVFDGIITAEGIGEATITAKTKDGSGLSATCVVTVGDGKTHVTSVSLDHETLTLEQEDTMTLVATVLPSDATDASVTWTSSNPDVVKVRSSGYIEALSVGEATITVTTTDGELTASCAITVQAKEPTFSNFFVERNYTNSGNAIITFICSYEDPSKVWNDKFTVKCTKSTSDGEIMFEGTIKPATESYAALNRSGRFVMLAWEDSYYDILANTTNTYYFTVSNMDGDVLKQTPFYGGQSFSTGMNPIPGSIILEENVGNNPTFKIDSTDLSDYDSINVYFVDVSAQQVVQSITDITLDETITTSIELTSNSKDYQVIVMGQKGEEEIVIIEEVITLSTN